MPLCTDLWRFRLRVLATLLRRSDCSLTRASTPEQTRIRQVAAERFPSSTHDSRPLARWSLRVDIERANCFPLMPAVWRAGWQQGDRVVSPGVVWPCPARRLLVEHSRRAGDGVTVAAHTTTAPMRPQHSKTALHNKLDASIAAHCATSAVPTVDVAQIQGTAAWARPQHAHPPTPWTSSWQ